MNYKVVKNIARNKLWKSVWNTTGWPNHTIVRDSVERPVNHSIFDSVIHHIEKDNP